MSVLYILTMPLPFLLWHGEVLFLPSHDANLVNIGHTYSNNCPKLYTSEGPHLHVVFWPAFKIFLHSEVSMGFISYKILYFFFLLFFHNKYT